MTIKAIEQSRVRVVLLSAAIVIFGDPRGEGSCALRRPSDNVLLDKKTNTINHISTFFLSPVTRTLGPASSLIRAAVRDRDRGSFK